MRYYKPIEIARELGVSTSALRHYESWGVIPAPERAANGYRLYTRVHLAYFRCLRVMFAGFDVAVACDVLRHIQKGDVDAAFWLVTKEQAKLQNEKAVADRTLALLQNSELPLVIDKKIKNHMTIGEAATLTDVPASAIRYWEKEGLLSPERNPENGYRMFTPLHIRQILLIHTLRKTIYFLENIKDIVQAMEYQDMDRATRVVENALEIIHERNRRQLYAIHQLVELCKEDGLIQ
ncbi:TioE family transcriptional regulator [Paenibacillus sp. P96]|uniref:TioE family transcriptional regulator n=1 Tax=Paenibacillus zeirhizosphaerae TaxID=2987519 RepID=A0ABT9FKY3_9BACL|nr:TioE family transcriptional regulator [Paenibacillus sp. P96]MDP4095392.1 TioE family transcriptional regulator [Paenibacillus sp. P96]